MVSCRPLRLARRPRKACYRPPSPQNHCASPERHNAPTEYIVYERSILHCGSRTMQMRVRDITKKNKSDCDTLTDHHPAKLCRPKYERRLGTKHWRIQEAGAKALPIPHSTGVAKEISASQISLRLVMKIGNGAWKNYSLIVLPSNIFDNFRSLLREFSEVKTQNFVPATQKHHFQSQVNWDWQ